MDGKRTAKRTIADSHVDAGTTLAPDLVDNYAINFIDLRGAVDEDGDPQADAPPALRVGHTWGDELASVYLTFPTDEGNMGMVVRQLDAGTLADYFEEVAKNLRMRDLGNQVGEA